MFAGSMRGPRMKTPLLLLLLLLTTLTGTVICQDEDDGADADTEATEEEAVEEADVEEPPEAEATAEPDDSLTMDIAVENIEDEDRGSGLSGNETDDPELDSNGTDRYEEPGDTEGLGLILILIPVVLVVLIIGMIVGCIVVRRWWNQKERNQELRKDDPYLDGSSTEKVPMPMFEEDVPSVLELEMEDFDQWMKKDDEPANDSLHS